MFYSENLPCFFELTGQFNSQNFGEFSLKNHTFHNRSSIYAGPESLEPTLPKTLGPAPLSTGS